MNRQCVAFISVPKDLERLELDCNLMPLLNSNNSAIVEACIKGLKGYGKAEKVYRALEKNRGGISGFQRSDFYDAFKAIAKENSTRTPDKCIVAFADYASTPSFGFLQDLRAGKPDLPDKLYGYVRGAAKRKEKSLSSKICRYLNDWAYQKEDYTINDSFARGVLPYYLYYHGVPNNVWAGKKGVKSFENEKTPYQAFTVGFDELKKKLPSLKVHELDHLLWYCFRNDEVRFAIAKKIAESNA